MYPSRCSPSEGMYPRFVFLILWSFTGKFLAGGVSAVGDSIQQGLNTDVLTVETRSDIPSYIPQASAETGGTAQKFASQYEAEAMQLPFKLLADIVEKMLSGKLLKPLELKIGYVNAYKKRLPKKSTTTPTQAIQTSGAVGFGKQAATLFAAMVYQLKGLNGLKKSMQGASTVKTAAITGAIKIRIKIFLSEAKKYNQLVARNGKANLQVDTAKSIKAGKVIPK